MRAQDILNAYSAEVLGFGFKGAASAGNPETLPAAPAAMNLERLAARTRAAFERSGRRHLVLLGLGSGALAAALAEVFPVGALCVCEQDLALVRALRQAGRLDWWRPGDSSGLGGLAADSSPWALFFLLDRAGISPQDALVLANPELPPQAKAAHRPLELLLTRSRPLPTAEAPPLPRLSVAAILAPSEPDLPEFFAQFPGWLAELVLVWDAEAVPESAASADLLPQRFPVRHLARPLGRDFSAQRGAMLAACCGDWVLYLDADERLSPEAWAAIPALCAASASSVDIAAWHFPRLTPYPDADHALTGFGLWPDVQLRLFRNRPTLRFVNPVHERLTGLNGAQALALDVEIEHLSRLRKGAEALRRKLSGFDEAGAGRVRHALSAEYPSLPRGLLAARRPGSPLRCLLLPPEFA
ncbi:MAG: glycosyl transferase family 2 [Humidesulfovibrio sp.]|nr:glycosyl transferase family 2 [Humidesulfovibrio sp.]